MLRFPNLQNVPGLRHGVTTRQGGVSRGPHASLNLGLHVGDEADAVRENRLRAAAALGFDEARLVCAQQVHGAQVHRVRAEDAGRGALDWDSAVPDCDALIVSEPGVPALILVADCAPVLIVAPDVRVFALVHAGWRGAVAGIAGSAIETMRDGFGAQPQAMLLGVGPCLCAACLEVGEEVVAQVPPQFHNAVMRGENVKPHLDLRALVRSDAQSHGVQSASIATMSECPRCDNARFFSHRAQGGTAGRFGLLAISD